MIEFCTVKFVEFFTVKFVVADVVNFAFILFFSCTARVDRSVSSKRVRASGTRRVAGREAVRHLRPAERTAKSQRAGANMLTM